MLKKIGKYEIVGELGSGGMGTVYKAYQPSLNRYVAIKILPTQFSQDKELVERFYREAKAAARLNHPRIAQIYDIGEENEIYYFCMELIKGKPLNTIIKEKGPLSIEQIVNISNQIAEALACAHKENLIHRDVKPGNIMVDEDNQVKVTDFGIAKAMESKGLTITGTIIGTPEYMSPEQARGDLVDKRSDLYSLGITMYEMITGMVPFKAATPYGIIQKQINESPPAISEIIPTCPREIQYIVQRAVAKNPAERYQDATELIRDLKNFQAGAFFERTVEVVSPKRKSKIWLWPLTAAIIAILTMSIVFYNFSLKKKKIISLPKVEEKKEEVKVFPKIEKVKEPEKLKPQAKEEVKEAEKPKRDLDEEAEKQFKAGEGLLEKGNYNAAISDFQNIIDIYPGTKWVDMAREKIRLARQKLTEEQSKKDEAAIKSMFVKGDNLFKESKFGEAILAYQEIIDQYPVSSHADEARRKIEYVKQKIDEDKISASFSRALEYENKGELVKATAIYQEILTKYPGSEWATKASESLARIEKIDKDREAGGPDNWPEIDRIAVDEIYDKDNKVRELVKKGELEPLALYLKEKYPAEMKKIAELMRIPPDQIDKWNPVRVAEHMMKFGPEKEMEGGRARDFIRRQRFPR